MNPTRRAARCCACAALLLLSGCGTSHPPGGTFAGAWPAVRETADSLVAAGRFAEAAHALGAAAAFVRAPYAAPWQRRERERLAADVTRWGSLGAAGRDSIAAIARVLVTARRAVDADSLLVAERAAREACARAALALGPAHPWTAAAQLALGEASFRMARAATTDSLATLAERSLSAAYGEDHPDVADADALLGRSLKNFGGRPGRAAALAHDERALRTRVSALGPLAPDVAESYQDLGNLERLYGQPAAALRSFSVALAIRRQSLGPRHPQVASTLSAMAMLCAATGRWASAESLLVAALAAAPDSTTSPLTRSFRLGLLGQVQSKLGRPVEAERTLREAIALSESAWALTPRDEGSTVFSGLSLYANLAMVLAEQGRAVEAFEALERGTSRTLVEHEPRTLHAADEPLLARVQREIAPDAALVSWVRARFGSAREEMAWACVVRASGEPRWIRLPRTAEPLPGGVFLSAGFWRELRATAGWPMRVGAEASERRLASAMGEAWFEPLERELAGVHHIVVFSPDLVGGGPLSAMLDSSGRSMLERYAVSYAPSAAFYAFERERRRDWAPGAATLVVGDPAYRGGAWPLLAGSREEIATVCAALPRVRVLAGADASASELRRLAQTGELSRFRVLHLATHTAVDPTRVLEASLVLAPDRPGGQESMLSAHEIADSWRLDADLVCLTGCQTAMGMRAASQGLLGLQQALFRAGARSVLVSLWPVDDQATALLMKEFYRRLSQAHGPGARAEALREAQRAVRDWANPSGTRPYAHPAYWAGFTLVGDAG